MTGNEYEVALLEVGREAADAMTSPLDGRMEREQHIIYYSQTGRSVSYWVETWYPPLDPDNMTIYFA